MSRPDWSHDNLVRLIEAGIPIPDAIGYSDNLFSPPDHCDKPLAKRNPHPQDPTLRMDVESHTYYRRLEDGSEVPISLSVTGLKKEVMQKAEFDAEKTARNMVFGQKYGTVPEHDKYRHPDGTMMSIEELIEYWRVTNEVSRNKGTKMHFDIELHGNGIPFESTLPEIHQYKVFEREFLDPMKLTFYRTEYEIAYPEEDLAGSIDVLLKFGEGGQRPDIPYQMAYIQEEVEEQDRLLGLRFRFANPFANEEDLRERARQEGFDYLEEDPNFLVNGDGHTYSVGDWKRSRPMTDLGLIGPTQYFQKERLPSPLDFLCKHDLYEYYLQPNIYRYSLEKYLGKRVTHMFLANFHERLDQAGLNPPFLLFECPRLHYTVSLIMFRRLQKVNPSIAVDRFPHVHAYLVALSTGAPRTLHVESAAKNFSHTNATKATLQACKARPTKVPRHTQPDHTEPTRSEPTEPTQPGHQEVTERTRPEPAEPEPAGPPQCRCRAPARNLLCKNGPNAGKTFWKCAQQECSFFFWDPTRAEESPVTAETGPNPTGAKARPSTTSTGAKERDSKERAPTAGSKTRSLVTNPGALIKRLTTPTVVRDEDYGGGVRFDAKKRSLSP